MFCIFYRMGKISDIYSSFDKTFIFNKNNIKADIIQKSTK